MKEPCPNKPYPHFPCEACENFKERNDWEKREATCLESFQKAGPRCRYQGWIWMKKNDPLVECEIHKDPG